jgi:3-dehydroquinate dehydratase type I
MSLKICIPIAANSLEALLSKMEEASPYADIIELWLGEIPQNELSFEKIFFQKQKIQKPLLLNVKAKNEHGNFCGTDEEKYTILLEGMKMGAEYIDIGYDYNEEYSRLLIQQKKETKVIISAHFFDGTPSLPSLLNRIEHIQKKGGDILKIAAMAKEKKDLLTILRLSENLYRSKDQFIAISMGEIGKSSRVLTPYLGSEMMFAALDESSISAPGQMTAEQLRTAWKLLFER